MPPILPDEPMHGGVPHAVLGFLNLVKPAGPTSTQIGARVRALFPRTAEKLAVGHLGTLDPMASGVLPIALGKATRLLPLVGDRRKRYVCTLVLGRATDTGDATGATLVERDVPTDLDDRLVAAIPRFVGAVDQVPPMYSAVKIGGKRAYALARAGTTVARAARTVSIYGIDVLGRDGDAIRLRLACSEGTYVRTLCEDLAAACGTVGHMGALLREANGPFVLQDALTLDEIAADPFGAVLAPERVIPLAVVTLDGRRAADFRAGRVVPLPEGSAGPHVFVRDSSRTLVGVGETLGALLAPKKVFV